MRIQTPRLVAGAVAVAAATTLGVGMATAPAQADGNGRQVLHAKLTGAAEVPGPGDPDGSGKARVYNDKDVGHHLCRPARAGHRPGGGRAHPRGPRWGGRSCRGHADSTHRWALAGLCRQHGGPGRGHPGRPAGLLRQRAQRGLSGRSRARPAPLVAKTPVRRRSPGPCRGAGAAPFPGASDGCFRLGFRRGLDELSGGGSTVTLFEQMFEQHASRLVRRTRPLVHRAGRQRWRRQLAAGRPG